MTGHGGERASIRPAGERGHLLVGLVVLVAVMLIMLTVAGQSWSFILRRDAEAELIFRGEQYAKAIDFYRKENGGFPMELKVLIQRGGPHRHRYIRRLFPDPIAEDGKWGLIYLSPSGTGFVNPYGSMGAPGQGFGAPGLPGGSGSQGFSLRGRSAFSRSRTDSRMSRGRSRFEVEDEEEIEAQEGGGGSGPRRSEAQERGMQAFLAMGLDPDRAGLPIAGVVHKKRETGVKLYKNMAYLNDWAFTQLAETQAVSFGGSPGASVRPPPQNYLGLGDSHNPIFLRPPPGSDRHRPGGKTSRVGQMQERAEREDRKREERERQIEEWQRLQEEERQRLPPPGEEEPPPEEKDEDAPAEGEGEEPAGEEGEPGDPNAPVDPNAPPDPNAPVDPNAPSDPNTP